MSLAQSAGNKQYLPPLPDIHGIHVLNAPLTVPLRSQKGWSRLVARMYEFVLTVAVL
ncbi:MAG: hypothetical protein HKN13_03460 [Rhodothermales bacterium]|nr:hypothetical protein [Rhodothermales bacterium]